MMELLAESRIDCELWDAMRLLTGKKRRMIYLAYWFGDSAEDIALKYNCSEDAVFKAISRARLQIKNILHEASGIGGVKTPLVVQGEKGQSKRGAGQTPDTQNSAPSGFGKPSPSQNPSPDIYFGSDERDDFLQALSDCCRSAVMQVGPSIPGHESYVHLARCNRERIAALVWKEHERLALRAA